MRNKEEKIREDSKKRDNSKSKEKRESRQRNVPANLLTVKPLELRGVAAAVAKVALALIELGLGVGGEVARNAPSLKTDHLAHQRRRGNDREMDEKGAWDTTTKSGDEV